MSSAVIPVVRVAILADSRLTEIALPVDLPLRDIELRKVPSISETVDWARALVLLHAEALSADLPVPTLAQKPP